MYKINQNHIDPLPLWREPGLLQRLLRRDEKRVPDQQAGETEEQYCERLRQVYFIILQGIWLKYMHNLPRVRRA